MANLVLFLPKFDDIRQNIINGIDSAQAEGTGWDALRSTIPVTAVVRTSATVVTVTLPALPSYDITAQETLTVTVPHIARVGETDLVGTPTFTVDTVVAAAAVGGAGYYMRQRRWVEAA